MAGVNKPRVSTRGYPLRSKMKNATPTLKILTCEDVIRTAKNTVKNARRPISQKEFVNLSGVTEHQITRLFPEGGWLEIQRLAGIPHHPKYHRILSDEELLIEFHRVVSSFGKIPTNALFYSRAKFSDQIYYTRFGCKSEIVKRYLLYLEENHPRSPLLPLVRAYLNQKKKPHCSEPRVSDNLAHQRIWNSPKAGDFGKAIDFRSLHYAPTNEKCLIYLFGIIALELGFVVETVRESYPDCIAKRRVDPTRGEERWQHIRIEFETKSSNFQKHRHNPANCDVIVCWKHDWQDCTLEVIELSRLIAQLPQ